MGKPGHSPSGVRVSFPEEIMRDADVFQFIGKSLLSGSHPALGLEIKWRLVAMLAEQTQRHPGMITPRAGVSPSPCLAKEV